MKKQICIIFFVVGFISCKSSQELETVNNVDLKKYSGLWYEIARLPNRFEKDMQFVTAKYILQPSGDIQVINSGITSKGVLKSSKGRAWVPNSKYPGRLKVSFFWPFSGDYYIIYLNREYTLALVGSPSRKYFWILSKNPSVDKSIYSEMLNIARNKGFDVSKIEDTKQNLINK